MTTDQAVGVAWYFAEEWEALRIVAPDPDVLEATHGEWLTVYDDGVRRLKEAGVHPKRVDVRLKDLLDWCEHTGRRPDGAARADYTAEVVRRSTQEGILLPDA